MKEILEKYRGAILTTLFLVLISPIFGIILANMIGYHEPLDLAAEKLGLHEAKLPNWTPFSDYTFPGLPDTLGYIVAGIIGTGFILAIGYLASKRLARQ